ncbi:MAG: ABC transporter permease [Chloroflexota bacterium]
MTSSNPAIDTRDRDQTSVVATYLAGLGTLVRFILRRDRIRIPVWVVLITALTVFNTSGLPDFYSTEEERQSRAELMSNPAAVALSGPGYGTDNYTYGAIVANEILSILAVVVGIMSILMVVRHTRSEEETGRAELLRASIVGRHAHLTAALLVMICTNLVLGLLLAAALVGLGLESIDWTGSLAFGLALAAVGITFGAVAAVLGQVFEYGRSATGFSLAALGTAYAVRAAGDMSGGTLSWASPIGWSQAMRAYVDERWWPLALALLFTAGCAAAAYYLSTKRDVAAGLRAPAPGPPAASDALTRPLGFALRLHKGSLIGWGVALLVFSSVYGWLSGEVEQFVSDNPSLEEYLGATAEASLIDSWLSVVVSFFAIICGIYATLAAMRLRGEETAGRVEPLLATSLSRVRWIGSHLAVALAGSVAMLSFAAVGLGTSAAISVGDWGVFSKTVGSTMTYIPAVWITVGLVVALFGLIPRFAALAWLVIAYAFTVTMLGELLQFPDWMYDLSPYSLVPAMPAEGFDVLPVLALTVLTLILIAVGLASFQRRDIEMT